MTRLANEKHNLIELICKCGNPYLVWPHEAARSKYCSKQCLGRFNPKFKGNWIPLIRRTCLACQQDFNIKRWRLKDPSRGLYCSADCAHKRSDEQSPAWKGGITSEQRRRRSNFRATVRLTVLERDVYTCQICQEVKQEDELHVDHIKEWAENPDLRFEVDNCRTLCRPCHYYVTFKKKMPRASQWGIVIRKQRI